MLGGLGRLFGRKKKSEPSQEEILGEISGILKRGQPSRRVSDAEAEKITAALGALLFEDAPKPPPGLKRDWITRSFDAAARLLVGVLVVLLTIVAIFGSVLFVLDTVSDMNTVLAYAASATLFAAFGPLLFLDHPGRTFKRRRGRKLWRYVLFTFVWSALVFAVGQEWQAAATCVAFVFLTQASLPWLFEKAEEVVRNVAEALERRFRRLVGVSEPPLLRANGVDSGKE